MDVNQLRIIIQTVLSQSGIGGDLNKIQQYVNQHAIELIPKLNAASTRNDIKLISNDIAKQLNSAFNLNLKGTDVFKTLNSDLTKFATTQQRLTQANSMQKWLDNNTNSAKIFGNIINNAIVRLTSNSELSRAELNKIKAEFTQIQMQARQVGTLGQTFSDKFSNAVTKFVSWGIAARTVMAAVREAKNGIKFVSDLDDALTNINYTMNVTSTQLEEIGNSSVQMAKDLNTSASNVLGAVKLYANANETAQSVLEKAQPAVMLSNVSGQSAEQEAKNLQAMQNQFQLTNKDLTALGDTIENVSAHMSYDYADGLTQITEGIQESGAAAKAAGMNYQRYMALLGAGIENTGLSGSQLANAYKTMMARVTSASKASIVNGEVSEGDISNAEKTLRSVGIEVRKDNDSFKDFDVTMGEIYKKLDSLSQVDLSKIAYDVAGVRRSSIFRSMIQSYGDYLKLAKDAESSSGTMEKTQEKYVDSLKGKLGELKATTQSFWSDTLNSNELKAVVVSATKVVDVIDEIIKHLGILSTVLAGVGITKFVKNLD